MAVLTLNMMMSPFSPLPYLHLYITSTNGKMITDDGVITDELRLTTCRLSIVAWLQPMALIVLGHGLDW